MCNKLDKKIDSIYSFLKDNKAYNRDFQREYYNSLIKGAGPGRESKVISLLYSTVNTQSQPKIGPTARFFQEIYENHGNLTSFKSLINWLNGETSTSTTYLALYEGLIEKPGWGPKTSALFCKNIFNLHSGTYAKGLKIWKDAPRKIKNEDRLYLPVDSVIIYIFQEIGFENANFTSINDYLNCRYKGDKIVLWDDLWFWGFITQVVQNNSRIHGINMDKYWCVCTANKDRDHIAKIERKANEFMKLAYFKPPIDSRVDTQ